MATGLSISTSSTLNFWPSPAVHSCPALKPLFASTIGAQPAQTLRANRTVLFDQRLVGGRPLDRRQLLGRLETVFLDGRRARRILARFGRLRDFLRVDFRLRDRSAAGGGQPAWERSGRCDKSQTQSAQGQRAPPRHKSRALVVRPWFEPPSVKFAERFFVSQSQSGRVFLYDRVLPGTLPFNEPPQVNRQPNRFIVAHRASPN